MKLYCKFSKLNQRKKEERRKNIFMGLLIFFGILLIFGSVVWGVLRVPFFKVKNVEVVGLKPPASGKLKADLEGFFYKEYFISKITGKDNILFWKESPREFLRAHPEYENVEINKDYFSREISVRGKEREKFGLWCRKTRIDLDGAQVSADVDGVALTEDLPTAAGSTGSATGSADVVSVHENQGDGFDEKCWWFDKEGIIFSLAPAVESELFNRVEDSTDREIVLGGKVLADGQFANLIKIYDVLVRAKINSKTLNIIDLANEETSIESLTDPEIYFSLRNDPGFAISFIGELKEGGKWKDLRYVDLRVPNRAYYK